MEPNQSADRAKRHHRARILAGIAIGLILLLFIAYLAVGAIAANRLTFAERLFTQDTPAAHGLEYEDIAFPAREDGLNIAAWYIPADTNQTPEDRPAVVMVHGWNASRTNAFNQRFLELAQALHQAGNSVLMIDLRGHGQSAESRFTFGRYERRDVLAAVDWLLAHGYKPGRIGLIGTSMGAASVVGAAAEEQAVGAVVTDSLFAEIYPVIKGLWVKQSGLPKIFLYPTLWMFRVMNGYDLASARPIDEIGKIAPRPLFLIHCQVDQDVPVEHFQRLKQAAPWAQTWLVQDCKHAEIFDAVPQEYAKKVIDFFRTSLR